MRYVQVGRRYAIVQTQMGILFWNPPKAPKAPESFLFHLVIQREILNEKKYKFLMLHKIYEFWILSNYIHMNSIF